LKAHAMMEPSIDGVNRKTGGGCGPIYDPSERHN